jgi:hypothetical protein
MVRLIAALSRQCVLVFDYVRRFLYERRMPKLTLPLCALCVLMSCTASFARDLQEESSRAAVQSLVFARYAEHLAVLSGAQKYDGEIIPDRFSPRGLALVRKYIKEIWHEAGFGRVQREPFSTKGNRLKRWSNGVNYYVEIPGRSRPEEIIVVGAHSDSVGLKIKGSNDNGTGAAAVLALAEALKKSGFVPERTIRFVLFDGEEMGYYGSQHHFAQAALAGEQIELFINLDMIGFPLTDHGTLFYDARHFQPRLSELMEQASAAMPADERIQALPGPRVYRSDHTTGTKYSFPSVGLVEHVRTWDGRTLRISPNYHTTRDVMTALDTGYAFRIVRYLASLTARAANSSESWTVPEDIEKREKACETLIAQGVAQ